MLDLKGLVMELADWDRQIMPLGGGDMLQMLVRFGFASDEEVEKLYRAAMLEFGEDGDYVWPPAYNELAAHPDDKIPF